MFWCWLAETIGDSITNIQRTIPLSEIYLWKAYYEYRWSVFDKRDYYDAQTALAIEQAHSVKKKSRRVKDYLIKFQIPKPLTPEQAKKRVISWVMALAAGGKKTLPPKSKRKK